MLGHFGKARALARWLLYRYEMTLQWPEDDPRHGIIAGGDEGDGFVAHYETYGKAWLERTEVGAQTPQFVGCASHPCGPALVSAAQVFVLVQRCARVRRYRSHVAVGCQEEWPCRRRSARGGAACRRTQDVRRAADVHQAHDGPDGQPARASLRPDRCRPARVARRPADGLPRRLSRDPRADVFCGPHA